MRFATKSLTALLGAGLLVAGAFAAPAAAAPAADQGWDISAIEGGLLENGVTQEVADSLIEKLEAGQVWDSMSGGEPVSLEQSVDDDGFFTSRAVYADGSIMVSSVETPSAESADQNATARGIASCRTSSSNGVTDYTGCWASSSTIIINAGFTVNYSTHRTGGAWIRSLGSHQVQIFSLGAGYADLEKGIRTKYATTSTEAKAEMTFRPTGATFATTARLSAFINWNGGTRTTSDF